MLTFQSGRLRGTIAVPGDKSISHRALILAASSAHPVEIENLNPGEDVAATAEALRALGAQVEIDAGHRARVHGGTLHDPARTIDCRNSGSTARMMMGVCTGAGIQASFDGDASLRRRPMEPVAAQLRAFGAGVETTQGRLPASVRGTREPQTRRFILLTPSAQVKTALLFAGVFAGVPVTTLRDRGSRDHTERLLRYLGADLNFDRTTVDLRSAPRAFRPIRVAGDLSAAAFFLVAATVAPGSALRIEGVGVNPSRSGVLDALLAMGAKIRLENPREQSGEPVADLAVESAPLRGITIGMDLALRAIDEIVVLAVAAAFAQGETRITGVRELRGKESDRLAAVARLLDAAGIAVDLQPDGLIIAGGTPQCDGAVLSTNGDHRTAMAAAALAAGAGALRIDDESSIAVSFPGFLEELARAQQ